MSCGCGQGCHLGGEVGSLAPVCEACLPKEGVASSLERVAASTISPHPCQFCKNTKFCRPCVCYEDEFFSFLQAAKEVLPNLTAKSSCAVLEVVEAAQSFCVDCYLKHVQGPARGDSPSLLSGPRFFPGSVLDDCEEHEIQGVSAASTVLQNSSFAELRVSPGVSQCNSRRTRKRRRRTQCGNHLPRSSLSRWRRIRFLFDSNRQQELESELTQLDEILARSQPESLERWTLDQLLNFCTSDESVGGAAIKIAVQDVISRFEAPQQQKTLSLRCSNVTQARAEVSAWLQSCKEDVVAIQQTHLHGTSLKDFARKLTSAGFRVYKGEALPTTANHSKGGIALLVRKHLASRDVHTFISEGCGLVAAERRTGHSNLLLVSLYLQCATPAAHYPNSEILAELMSLLKTWRGPWLVLGDFNLTPLEVAEAGIPLQTKGVLIPPSEPSLDNGNTLDMALVSKDLALVATIVLDHKAPHRPRASLLVSLQVHLAVIWSCLENHQ